MKKVSKLLMLVTGIVFVAQTANAYTLGSTDTVDVTLSAGVSAVYKSNNAKAYSAVTKHYQGDREFGTASDLGQIMYKDATVGSSVASSDVGTGDSSDFSTGWTEVGQ